MTMPTWKALIHPAPALAVLVPVAALVGAGAALGASSGGLLTLAGVLGVPLLAFGVRWYLGTGLSTDGEHLVIRRALVRSKTITVPLTKVDHVTISQNRWGRLMNYGAVIAVTRDHSKVGVPGVARPAQARQQILDRARTAGTGRTRS